VIDVMAGNGIVEPGLAVWPGLTHILDFRVIVGRQAGCPATMRRPGDAVEEGYT
jgi:hypothetical protein